MKRTSLAAQESGSALIAGIIVLMIIMLMGAVAIQAADVQTHQTAHEQAGEAAFNVAESALDAESAALAQAWPASSGAAWPVCTQAGATSSTCPQGGISTGYSTTYAGSVYNSPTWSVQLLDDNVSGVADANYYSDSILTNAGRAHYDANGDGKLWIRASGTISGQTRTLVSLVTRQSFVVDLPQNVVTSGGVMTSNNGNKVIIEAKDPTSGLTGTVDVRCGDSSTTPSSGSSCAGWDARHGQLDPAGAYATGYTDPATPYQTLTNGEIEALRESAESSGTYYATGTCPTEFTAGVLFVENANCTYTGNGNWDSDAAPGAIVFAKGTLTITGGVNFYGVVYMADGQGSVPSSPPCTSSQQNAVFVVQGSASIHGGLFIDKCGTATVGSSGNANLNLQYDTTAFGGLRAYSTPSLALSTFRVLGNS